MDTDISVHRKLFSGVLLWIDALQIQAFPVVFRMSGFERVNNYNAQDGKFFCSDFFSGVVNLLKHCSDSIHVAWKKYHWIKIQQYVVNLQFLLFQMF